ncbi:MAG: hypothetical protein J6A28_03750 [Clostridia bacterium]|nr:hypothetical protein [Clostridia bacterium]
MERTRNIVLVSLNDKFCKSAGKNLADRLDMFSVDCEEMVEYNLINPKEVIEKCGLEYFKKKQRAAVRNCSEYENTVISISYDLYRAYQSLFEESLAIYIRLPHGKQDKVPSEIDFETRDAFLTNNAQILIELEQKQHKKCINMIIQKMGEYYENC